MEALTFLLYLCGLSYFLLMDNGVEKNSARFNIGLAFEFYFTCNSKFKIIAFYKSI